MWTGIEINNIGAEACPISINLANLSMRLQANVVKLDANTGPNLISALQAGKRDKP